MLLIATIAIIVVAAGIIGYVAFSGGTTSTTTSTTTSSTTLTSTQTTTATRTTTVSTTSTATTTLPTTTTLTSTVPTTTIQTTTYTTTITSTTNPPQVVSLTGAGASFPYPLLSTMIVEYAHIYSNVRINYQSIGSGGGVRQHINKTVSFAASDAPLTDAQRAAAPNTLHIPETIGSVVIAYNIPGIKKGLNMTGSLIAQIFMGNISKWNDPAIASLNPGVQLPDKDILVVHRSDGSGTTFVFTGYLSTVSSEWKSKIGQSTAVQWPIGLGSSGNEGVAGLVRGTTYTIGYVELAYALTNSMSYAYVQNSEGRFIEPTLQSTSAAAIQKAPNLPRGNESWKDVNLLNAAGADTYPIASFSYILVYKELSVIPGMDYLEAKTLVDFLWWAIHDGQSYAPSLQYVPLPQNVVSINEQTINSITFNGQSLRS